MVWRRSAGVRSSRGADNAAVADGGNRSTRERLRLPDQPLGVTGLRDHLPAELPDTVARLRRETVLPICVGFGIARPEQARAVAEVADGVAVGSAIVRAADDSVESAVTLAAALRAAIDSVTA